MAIGGGAGLGGFATGLAGGITAGTNLARTMSYDKFLNTRSQEQDLQLQQQQQQQADQKATRDAGASALTTYQQKVDAGLLPANHFSDYYVQNVLPGVVSQKMANGDVAGAAALTQWGQSEKKQSMMNNLGVMAMQIHHADSTGDYQPLNDNIKTIWNGLPSELTGGAQFQRLEVAKDSNGNPQSVAAVYLGPDGKIVRQNYNSPAEFLQTVKGWSDPSSVFEAERQKGLLDPLVTADTTSRLPGSAAPAAAPAPSSTPDDATAFNTAPLASTDSPLSGGASQSAGAVPAAPALKIAPPEPAPISTDTVAGSAAPAPSSVQPLAASSASPDMMAATPDATALAGGAASPLPTGAAITGLNAGVASAMAPAAPPMPSRAAAPIAPAAPMPAATAPMPVPQPDPRDAMSGAAPMTPAPLVPPDASQPAPNVTIVPTQPVAPGAPAASQPQVPPPAGLTPEVHDAIVQGLASGDPQAIALANKVAAKYATPKYNVTKLADGSLIAINPSNPTDNQVIYRAGGNQALMGVGSDLHGADYLKTIPANQAALVQKLANYEIDPRTLSTRGGSREQALSMAAQYDPTYDSAQYPARAAAIKEFNTGGPNSPAGQITAGNTALQHLGHLWDLSQNLGGTNNYSVLNSTINYANSKIKGAESDPTLASYNAGLSKFIEEATKFYRGTGGNEADLQRDLENLSAANSPAARSAVMQTLATFFTSKVNALQDRWKTALGPTGWMHAVGQQPDDFKIIQGNSQAAFNKIMGGGSDAGGGAAPLSNGVTSSGVKWGIVQ